MYINVNSSYLQNEIAENQIIRNEFNGYASYTQITCVGTVYAFYIKRKLPQPMLYSYELSTVAIELIP